MRTERRNRLTFHCKLILNIDIGTRMRSSLKIRENLEFLSWNYLRNNPSVDEETQRQKYLSKVSQQIVCRGRARTLGAGLFGASPYPMESQTHSAGLPTDAIERAWQTRNFPEYLTAGSCCFLQIVQFPVDVAQTPFHFPHSAVHDCTSWHHQSREHRDSTQIACRAGQGKSLTNQPGFVVDSWGALGKSDSFAVKCGDGINYLWGFHGSFCFAAVESFYTR